MEYVADKFRLFTIFGSDTLRRHGNLLISYETFIRHMDRVHRNRTKHPLPKINNIVEIENYLNSTNPKIIKAKKLYIEYLKKFTGFEKIELVWNPCRKYKGKEVTADCVIIQRVYI